MTGKNDILFISDLHLALDKPEITRRFINFLNRRAIKAAKLYILGDLFDAWIGDDDFTPPNKPIKKHLKHLVESGTQVFLQLGNRDFLLGQQFCAETGIILLPDYAIIELSGRRTLLMHGDLLCTDDTAYQQFRLKSHTPTWRDNVLSKPLWLRLLAARWYRLRSFMHKRKKRDEIMDVNQETVANTLREHQCYTLIHGHTHRPALHEFMLDGKPAQRMVLAAWERHQAQILCWSDKGFATEII